MKAYFGFLFLFLSMNIFGQTEYGSNVLFKNNEKNKVGGYFSFDGSLCNINENTVGSAGVTIAATVSHAFSFGATGSWFFNYPYNIEEINGRKWKKYCGYGGILLEPTILPRFPFHITFPCVVGIGGLRKELQPPLQLSEIDNYSNTSCFFIFTVGTRLEFNLIDGLRLTCGPSYRYIPNLKEVNSTMLNTFCLDFSIKIGKY